MSEEPKKERTIGVHAEGPSAGDSDFRQLLQPALIDDKSKLIRDLVTDDANTETKTRIPDVFNMSVMDLIGQWPTFLNQADGLSKLSVAFGHRYRVNAISQDGKSREEYTNAVTGVVAEKEMEKDAKRLQEGNRK